MHSLILAAIFVTTSAIACPDLSGTYAACRSTTGANGNTSNFVVSQAVQNGTTVFTLTSTDDATQERTTETIIADDVARTQTMTVEGGAEIQVAASASCQGNSLVMAQIMSYQGQDLGSLAATASKSGNTLTIYMNGAANGQQFTDTVICQ